MIKKIPFMISIAMTLTACVSDRLVDQEVACRDRRITVRHGEAYMDAYPPRIDVCRNTTLHVNLVPRVPIGNARTFAGPGAPEWLNRSNTTTGEILVPIPADATVGERYKYGVVVDDAGQLDPYIRIIF